MKKVLLLIISVLFAIQANAQEQKEAPTVTIDSLSTKLAKLQHDYDFLYCDYKLYKKKIEVGQLAQDIKINANGFTFNMYHGQYNHTLYTSYSDLYNLYCDSYDNYKRDFEGLQRLVMGHEFTEIELCRLGLTIEMMEKIRTMKQNKK